MGKKVHQSIDGDMRKYASIPSSVQEVKANIENYVKAKNTNEYRPRSKFHFFDSFARANSNVDLGVGETNGSAYTYATGTTSAVWGIESGLAKAVSISTPSRSIAYQETNESDCIIEAEISVNGSTFSNGIAFRITDHNNFLYVTVFATQINIGKIVAGTLSSLGNTLATNWGSNSIGDCKLTVHAKGSKIMVYVDGILVLTVFDSFNSTATKHGLYSRMEDFVFRWKTFSVKELSPIPFYIKDDFENGISKWFWKKETAGLSHSQTFSTQIKKSGTQSLRIELRKDDPDVSNSKRCEILLPSEKCLEEHWYGVSIYLPKGGDEDYAIDKEAETIIQWHNTPDTGEENISPPLCIETLNGNYTLKSRYDAGRMSTQNNPRSYTTYEQNLGSYEKDKGRWVDWVFHVRWGYLEIHEPILEVYKDGVLVVNRNGYPNTVNDKLGNYLKIGLYKWGWKEVNSQSTLTKRVIYYDNFFVK